jgi:hypothetical protein
MPSSGLKGAQRNVFDTSAVTSVCPLDAAAAHRDRKAAELAVLLDVFNALSLSIREPSKHHLDF